MSLIELSDYYLSSEGLGSGLKSCFFAASKGEVWKIESDNINDTHLFLSGLATLSYPSKGLYSFNRNQLNFCDYRDLLSTKKRIGYLSSDSTLISNRTIRENLTLQQVYFNNNLSPELNDTTFELCKRFNISDVLDVRPVDLKPRDIKKSLLVRELLKNPELFLVEYPGEFSGHDSMDDLISMLQDYINSGTTLIYHSHDEHFIKSFSHNTISIKNGILKSIFGGIAGQQQE